MEFKNEFSRGLAFWYRLIVASESLLRAAMVKAEGELLDCYRRHLEEETGHDEMLRDDLARLGVTDIPHSHIAAQLAGSQYYLIVHDDPALLLGYMHALESSAMNIEAVDELERKHGTELTALRHHALHDPQHCKELEAMILSLDDARIERVAWNEACVRRFLEVNTHAY